MMMFDEKVAMIVSTDAAVLFYNIMYWIEKNAANRKHFHDGKYWTYNSMDAFSELFPFLNKPKVKRLLTELKEAGLIETGNYNSIAYDRTLWYSLTEKGNAFSKNDTFHIPKMENGSSESDTPIPDSNPSSKTDIKQKKKGQKFQKEVEEIVSFLNEKTKQHFRPNTESIVKLIVGWLEQGYTVNDFQRVIVAKKKEWYGSEWQRFLVPSTLFGKSHFQEYLGASPEYKELKFEEPEIYVPKPGEKMFTRNFMAELEDLKCERS